MKKKSFLFSLLMAIVMMAMCPATLLAADGDKPWLCFTAQRAGSKVQLTKKGSPTEVTFETSTDGSTWTTYIAGTTGDITLANVGDKVYFRNSSETPSSSFSTSDSNYYQFAMSGRIAASGNVMSLMDKTCTTTAFDATSGGYAFSKLFYGCYYLTTAPELPATTLAQSCYYQMFQNCENLTTAPNLPTTTLAANCYQGMFSGSGLTAAPELPATALQAYCYTSMFSSCNNLSVAPELPATTLAQSCYYHIFQDCRSLTTAPELPNKKLENYCYEEMFHGCSSLKINTDGPGYSWAIPSDAGGSSDWNYHMFYDTSGTFTDDPEIGTTYYLASTPSVKLNSEGYATYSTYFNAHIETEGVKAYKATVDGTTITLTALDGDIPAGTGVLLYGEGKGGTEVTFSASATAATNASDNALKPTTITPCVIVTKPATGFNYALSGNEFKKYTGASFIHNRAFLNLNTDYSGSSVKGMSIVFADGEATAINNVNVNVNVNAKRLENGRIVILNNGRKYNTAGQQMK